MMRLPGQPADQPGEMSFEEIEHELRTPLASIRSLSEILRDHPDLSPEQRQRFLEGVLSESARLARTIERLLGARWLQQALG
jgi:signal transduction histidine kinase